MTPNGTLDREGDGGRASHTVFVCVSEFATRGLDEAGSGHWRRGFLPTGEQPKRSVPGRCAAPRELVPLETSWHLSMSPPRTPPRLSPCPQPAPGAPGHNYLWEAQTVSAMQEASRRKQKPTGGLPYFLPVTFPSPNAIAVRSGGPPHVFVGNGANSAHGSRLELNFR